MDPLTLFALANGAVAAVKKGCQLYKDIKGAAGDVKAVLKDLDQQFHNAYAAKGKSPSPEAKKQFVEEKNRIIELNKKGGEVHNVYQEIGEFLGQYYDNYHKCLAVLEEEERRSKNEVYTGDASLGKRALQRVLMRKQLEQMGTELRELMVYQSPPELGALYTEVEEMMKVMGKEQKVAIALHMKNKAIIDARNKKRKEKMIIETAVGFSIFFVIAVVFYIFMLVVDGRIARNPELGNCVVPRGSYLYKKWTKTVWSECK